MLLWYIVILSCIKYYYFLLHSLLILAEESDDFSVYCLDDVQEDGLIVLTAMATITTSSEYGTSELFCSSENEISTGNDTGYIITQGILEF